MIDDASLLRRYASTHSEEAFAELVRRHLPMVYSAALRRLGGDTHRAADVAQSIFARLSRDAVRLSKHPVLTGWLYTATRNAAIDTIRAETRREAREQETHAMQEILHPTELAADWEKLRPVLDGAMDELDERDRELVLLRFFQNRPFGEIGAALDLSDEAARKRVDRALDKLRGLLGRRGITSTSAALAVALTNETAIAAPAVLAADIATAAASKATATAAILMTTTTKLSFGVAAVLLACGTAALVFQSRTTAQLRAETSQLRQQSVKLEADNARLMKTQSDAATEKANLRSTITARSRESSRPAEPTRSISYAPTSTTASVTPGAQRPVATKNTPEERARLHQRYDPFLVQRLGLTPAQADRFVALKIAIYDAQDDLQAAVEKNEIQGGTDGVEALRSKLTKPMWDEIRQILGPEGFSSYRDYESTSAYLPIVVQIFRSVGLTASDEEATQVARLIDKNHQTYRAKPTDISRRVQIDWNAVAHEAESTLTPAQVAAIRAFASRQSPN